MPKIQWERLPREKWAHLRDRAKERQISENDLLTLAEWKAEDPDVPDGGGNQGDRLSSLQEYKSLRLARTRFNCSSSKRQSLLATSAELRVKTFVNLIIEAFGRTPSLQSSGRIGIEWGSGFS